MFDRFYADQILDSFIEAPGTLSASGNLLGTGIEPPAEYFTEALETVKARAAERGMTVDAWIQDDAGKRTLVVQHIIADTAT